MKKLMYVIAAFSVLLMVAGSCQQKAAKSGEWKLVWEDEFDEIDWSVWSKIPRGGSDWNNYMSDEDTLFDCQDGNLILRGIAQILPNDTAPYITGGLFTHGKKTFHGGKIEIRAKLPNVTGSWPAFWMLPEEGQWPMGGEIDIMEKLSHDTIAYQTVHTNYTYVLKKDTIPPHGGIGPIDPNGYNVYSVEIHPDSLVFAINGVHTFTYPKLNDDAQALADGQYPFYQPNYLMIDMQLGGKWVGEVDPAELPAIAYIDWVKYYQKEE